MRIAKLPVNQSWVLLLGDDTIVGIHVGVTEQRLFPTRESIVSALESRGLRVTAGNLVSNPNAGFAL